MKLFAWRHRAESRQNVEAELDEELGVHLEMAQRELEADGAAPAEAEAAARERFGDLDRVRRECLQIANGEQTMIKNILLAASLVVILTLSLMCVHFYSVARAAKQEAIMQRLLAEQEMQKAQTTQSFLQHLFLDANPQRVRAEVDLPLLVASALVREPIALPAEVEVQLRAATQAATQSETSDDDP